MLVSFLLLKIFLFFLITYIHQRSFQMERTSRKAFWKKFNWIFIKGKPSSEYYMRRIVPHLWRSKVVYFVYILYSCVCEKNKLTKLLYIFFAFDFFLNTPLLIIYQTVLKSSIQDWKQFVIIHLNALLAKITLNTEN